MDKTARDKKSRVLLAAGWYWYPSTMELSYDEENYNIDILSCDTSAQVLDWIFQIRGKRWATDDCIAGLIDALKVLLHPQAFLCSGGYEQGPVNVPTILMQTIYDENPGY